MDEGQRMCTYIGVGEPCRKKGGGDRYVYLYYIELMVFDEPPSSPSSLALSLYGRIFCVTDQR